MTATSKKNSAAEAVKPVEAAVAAGKETVEAVMKAGTDAATKQYEQAVALTKEQVEKASTSLFKGYDELAALNKANLDAVVTSSNTLAKGFEVFSKEVMSFAQGTMEANLATTKKLFGARNLQEIFDLQNELARTNFDKALSESAKLSELSMKVANEAFEPIQTRTQQTVEKLFKQAAA